MHARLRGIFVTVYRCITSGYLFTLIYSFLISKAVSKCGKGLRIQPSTTITGRKNIVIGDNFISMGGLYLYANDGGYLQIGNNVDVNTNVQLGAASGVIKIGDNVMIAPNVVIRAANHGMSRSGIPMKMQRSIGGVIVIGDDVWVGANAVICSNVTLAKGTVVAAGAVVTKSTEEFTIVGGVPARVIGERS
jgi:galactoside O-acetyltransferase